MDFPFVQKSLQDLQHNSQVEHHSRSDAFATTLLAGARICSARISWGVRGWSWPWWTHRIRTQHGKQSQNKQEDAPQSHGRHPATPCEQLRSRITDGVSCCARFRRSCRQFMNAHLLVRGHQRCGWTNRSGLTAWSSAKQQASLRADPPLLRPLVHSHSFTWRHWQSKKAALLTANRRGTKTGPVQQPESWVRLLWMFRWRYVLDSTRPASFARGGKMQCRSLLKPTGDARWTAGSGSAKLPGRAFFAVALQKYNGRGWPPVPVHWPKSSESSAATVHCTPRALWSVWRARAPFIVPHSRLVTDFETPRRFHQFPTVLHCTSSFFDSDSSNFPGSSTHGYANKALNSAPTVAWHSTTSADQYVDQNLLLSLPH